MEEFASNLTDWPITLLKSMIEDEALFIVNFDSQSTLKRQELEPIAMVLIRQAIVYDKIDSFVKIFDTYTTKDISCVAEAILSLNRAKIFEYFLNHAHVTDIKPKWMLEILKNMTDLECEIDSGVKECFHVLLNHPKYKINEKMPQHGGETVLHYATTTSEYAVVELLKKGASLTSRNRNGKMPIQCIEKSTMAKYFDSCISTWIPDNQTKVDNYYIVFDVSVLTTTKDITPTKETSPTKYMAESSDLQSLFQHPVIVSYLFMYWYRASRFFYLNLVFFSMCAIAIGIHMSFHYVDEDHPNTMIGKHKCWILACCSWILLVVKKLAQLMATPASYLKSIENYFEIAVMCLEGVVLMMPLENQKSRRTIAAVLFLGIAIEWTLILSALPIFSVSNHILMLKNVATNFLTTLAFYLTLLLAFSLSFYTLLNTSEGSDSEHTDELSLFSAFYHVILMLTGDFEPISEKLKDLVSGRIFLLVFVLSMAIVMMNLLLGLTVSDTVKIKKEAERHKWLERAKLLGKYEDMYKAYIIMLKYKFLQKMYWRILVWLMPNYHQAVKILIDINNKWICKSKEEKFQTNRNTDTNFKNLAKDIEGGAFQSRDTNVQPVCRSYCGCWKVPIKMDEWIIDSGMDLLEQNRDFATKQRLEEKIRFESDKRAQSLTRLEREVNEMSKQIQYLVDSIGIILRDRRSTP